ncbi:MULTISPECIES: ABC transporter ATP-binding protein [unclassified Facklamia]|uniref:ABC transporter ATP-binding protein n=1 Tax=Aerococcaceae TaxID=186827 RepID=UPI0013B93444|nr:MULTISPECIES: ABC transporter ATP-binding protein [unclassified Facklamia]NEW65145.1 ATP-binding cassette domain-containing protein [Facklamia sp. 252]NEW68536.1 ATP-binding cassette domain-containing protein [Facklamia sp. 253]QQD65947.1 ABC transporter ATP-binding protein [Aerococcaceae bacterium zg-252]
MIEVNKLYKTIRGQDILKDISFTINKGDCVALIGPNGAGKTTLMSCMIGDKFISKGRLMIEGVAAMDSTLKTKVAILPQENVAPENLTVAELIAFFQKIHRNALSTEEIDALLGFSAEQKNQLTEKLSGGQRRLMSFVLILIGKPSILFLDEPTAGMDTSIRQRFWEIINQLKTIGTTIVYSSHYIEEVEHTADRILVLHKGELLRDTTPYKMRSEEREKQFNIPIAYQESIQTLDMIYDIKISHDIVTFMTKEPQIVFDYLQKAGCPIDDMEMLNKTLLNTLFDNTSKE